jgi:hypothetical protein
MLSALALIPSNILRSIMKCAGSKIIRQERKPSGSVDGRKLAFFIWGVNGLKNEKCPGFTMTLQVTWPPACLRKFNAASDLTAKLVLYVPELGIECMAPKYWFFLVCSATS